MRKKYSISPRVMRILSLLLALVVLVGSLGWSPAQARASMQTPASASDAAVALIPRFTARIIGSQLYVNGSNFPRRHTYFVRAREAPYDPWIRLGTTRSNSNGKIDARFRLPRELRNAWYLRVCLKDVYTNAVYCVNARRY
ncbi:MAG: hypothetical protein QME21_14690 [Anaerolineales bacterium]|nr:hypothetical protein [Anaerolineales bacterium]